MHIEFIDLLRCPRPHEETWLVAALQQMEGRHVVEAKLGCPVCGAEFFIRDGVALFDDDDAIDAGAQPLGDDDVMHIAAFLNLTAPGKIVLLAGRLASASESLGERVDARVISLNSTSRTNITRLDRVAEIRAATPLPLAAKSLDAIALDDAHSTPQLLAEAGKVLRPRGRLVAGSEAELSAEFRELARDSDHVVAECVGELVTLRR
jgi:uncharacterized protein YbaR (Trm112 family)